MFSGIVSQICSQVVSFLGGLPFFGTQLADLVNQVCANIVQILTSLGL